MIKSVKGLFRLLCVICVAMLAVTTIGSAAWYFFVSIEENQEAGKAGDSLRPNQTFGEKEDVVLKELEYYDVYFLAQNVANIENFLVEDKSFVPSDGRTNYKFKDLSKGLYYEHHISGVPEGDLRFGSFEGRSSASPYYYKLSHVETVTNAALDTIGKPTCQLVDGNSDQTDPSRQWVLQFSTWCADPYPELYSRDNATDGRECWVNDQYIQVFGSVPYHDFDIAYFNSLLSIYDSRAYYINGTKTLFFYPIYTIGKSYYLLRTGQSKDRLRDCIALHTSAKQSFFTFDERYTNLLEGVKEADGSNRFPIIPTSVDESNPNSTTNTVRYLAYRYFDYVVDNEDINIEGQGYISNDMDTEEKSWSGNGQNVQRGGNLLQFNNEAGRFNIYLIVKERFAEIRNIRSNTDYSVENINPHFTAEDIQKISEIFVSQDINIHAIYDADLHEISRSERQGIFGRYNTYFFDTRDYIIVKEKRYEPRLIGGRTNAFNYNDQKSIDRYFTQNGVELAGDKRNSYDLRAVKFLCEDDKFEYIEFTADVYGTPRIMRIPNYYFAVQLSRAKVAPYDQKLFDDTKTDAELNLNFTRPTYRYKLDDGSETIFEEPYQSSSLLIKLEDAINLEYEEYKKEYEKNGGHFDKENIDESKFFYKDVYRIQVTKLDPSIDPTFYDLAEYKYKAEKNEAGFTDYDNLIKSLNLVRPKESGSYNVFAHLSFQDNATDDSGHSVIPLSVDIWAYRRHNIFVNIVDPADFTSTELEEIRGFNGNYIRGALIDRFSFRCDKYYYLEKDFLYEEERQADGSPISKRFIRKSGLGSFGLSPDAEEGRYSIESILNYYDAQGKCLQDIITGRYITPSNAKANPFIIEKNYILMVVDKPAGIV